MSQESPQPERLYCEKHGDYDVRYIFMSIIGRSLRVTACPDCCEEQEAQRKEDERNERKREEIARWERRIGKAGIPDGFHDRTLETFCAKTEAQQHALAFAQAFAKDLIDENIKGQCAIFLGGNGTGKTHLAVGIGLKLMEARKSVYITTVYNAIGRIKATWNKNAEETEVSVLETFKFPDLLIFDEMSVQFGSDAEKLIFFDICNERYGQRKATIFLTNLSIEDVKIYLGDRVLDRIRERNGQIIALTGESYRKQKGQP